MTTDEFLTALLIVTIASTVALAFLALWVWLVDVMSEDD